MESLKSGAEVSESMRGERGGREEEKEVEEREERKFHLWTATGPYPWVPDFS